MFDTNYDSENAVMFNELHSDGSLIGDSPTALTIHDASTGLNEIIPYQRDVEKLGGLFFNLVKTEPDGTFRSPLCSIRDVIKPLGCHDEVIRAVDITVLTMISGHLGYPMALILIDETRMAQDIVYTSKHFVPSGWVFENMEMKLETIYMPAKDLPGKVILTANISSLNRVKPDLEHLIEHGYVSRQEKVTSKYHKSVEQLDIKGPVSLVTISDDTENADWKGNNVIKIPLSSGNSAGLGNVLAIEDEGTYVECCWISKTFERYAAKKVVIPFWQDILCRAQEQSVSFSECVLKPFETMLSLIAIINNPDKFRVDEVFASLYNTSRSKVGRWLSLKGYDSSGTSTDNDRVITATKVDYYIVSKLLGEHLDAGSGDRLTERQEKVFKTIKRCNLRRLGLNDEGCKDDNTIQIDVPKNDVEKLTRISRDNGSWVDREKIFELINVKGNVMYSASTVYNELQVLIDKGLIERHKIPKSTKHAYHVTTLEIGKPITLPDPSTIIDPIYKGEKVKVVNPITGQIEEI